MKDINYGEILKKSWTITIKNKWLWVMGLVLATFSGSGGGSNLSSNSSISDFSDIIPQESPSPVDFKDQTSDVLGKATSVIGDWFSNIPIQNWIVIGLSVFIFIVFIAIMLWILTSWAKGALIGGIEDADSGKQVNLKTASFYGVNKIKDLIVFNFISFGIGVLVLVVIAVIIGIGFILKTAVPALGVIWLILFGIVSVLLFVVTTFLFSMLSMYAERLIVLKNYTPWNAWKKSLNLSKGNFFSTLLMGIINNLLGCGLTIAELIVILIVFALPGYLLLKPMFENGFHFPSLGNTVGTIILAVLLLSITRLIGAVFTVFKYGNWNLFFKEIIKKEEDG